MSCKSPTSLLASWNHAVVPPSAEVARYGVICLDLSPKDEYVRNFGTAKNDGFTS